MTFGFANFNNFNFFGFNGTQAPFSMPAFTPSFPPIFTTNVNLFNFSMPAFRLFEMPLMTPSSYSEDTFYPELSGKHFDSTRFMNFDFMPAYPVMPEIKMPKLDFSKFSTKKTSFYSNLKPSTTTTLAEVAKIYNKEKGAKLAAATINGLQNSQKGYCARAVKTGIANAGLGAYQSGDADDMPAILKNNTANFKEVSIAAKDIKKLPAGCILCYAPGDAGYNPRYGHTETTDGNGNAVSFYVNNNIKESDNVRVFVPV